MLGPAGAPRTVRATFRADDANVVAADASAH